MSEWHFYTASTGEAEFYSICFSASHSRTIQAPEKQNLYNRSKIVLTLSHSILNFDFGDLTKTHS